MSRAVVSKRIHKLLINHLTKIKEEKLYAIEKYYPVWTSERSDFQELLDSYIEGIESTLRNELEVDDNAPDACPFVIIGSRVLLKDSYTNKTEEMQIVSPFKDKINLNVDSASYLSPMGRAFLLKEINDEIKVETPMGIFQYRIEAIEVPSDMF